MIANRTVGLMGHMVSSETPIETTMAESGGIHHALGFSTTSSQIRSQKWTSYSVKWVCCGLKRSGCDHAIRALEKPFM